MRNTSVVVCLALIASGGSAAESPKRTAPTFPAATRLRTLGRVPFAPDDGLTWIHPALCDADGNIVVVTVPDVDPRDLKNLPAAPRYTKNPSDITVISADGKKQTVMTVSTIRELADADQLTTMSSAMDSMGNVFALVWAARPEQLGRQYIVSFDRTGKYRSQIDIDLDEMTIQHIAVFGSGELLLKGVRPDGTPRVAVMPSIGGALQDVIPVNADATADRSAERLAVSEQLARGSDGRIYFLAEGGRSIHAIAATGTMEEVFKLAPVPRNWRPFDLKVAGNRLAITYQQEGRTADTGRFWVAVHDAALGERLALYGPERDPAACYEAVGRDDRLTMLRGGHLVRLAP
jgi:hypothetical protein